MPSLQALGQRQTSYADLMPNSVSYAPGLRQSFLAHLKNTNFPDIDIFDDKINIALRSRPYTFVRHKSGSRMTIALREYGNDLLLTWTLWFGSAVNWLIIGAVVLLFLLALFSFSSRAIPIALFFVVGAIGLLIYALAQGLVSKKLDFFAEEDMVALCRAVNYSMQQAIDQLGLEFKLRDLDMPADLGAVRRRAI